MLHAGVVKTYVSEVTDETNIAKALGLVAMQYGAYPRCSTPVSMLQPLLLISGSLTIDPWL